MPLITGLMKLPVQSGSGHATDNRDKRLVPGMFADLTLITDEKNNAIQVPTEAVVPDMNEKRVWVYSSGKAALVPVVAGTRTETMVEILSGISVG
ncbi:MAG: hypothetical protein MZV63_02795 [Marinilabiliales bacterium]|nr:hypothetical protein [Marinilabiliales bacterium]